MKTTFTGSAAAALAVLTVVCAGIAIGYSGWLTSAVPPGTEVGVDTPPAGLTVSNELSATVLLPGGSPANGEGFLIIEQSEFGGNVESRSVQDFVVGGGALYIEDIWPRDAFSHTAKITIFLASSGPAPTPQAAYHCLLLDSEDVLRCVKPAISIDFSSTSSFSVDLGIAQLSSAPAAGSFSFDDLSGNLSGGSFQLYVRHMPDGYIDHNVPEDDVLGSWEQMTGSFVVGDSYDVYSWADGAAQWQLFARADDDNSFTSSVVLRKGSSVSGILAQNARVSGSVSAQLMSAGAFYVALEPTGAWNVNVSSETNGLEDIPKAILTEVNSSTSLYEVLDVPRDSYTLRLYRQDLRTVLYEVANLPVPSSGVVTADLP